MSANLNAWWCDLIWQAIAGAGCELVVACPGNRNVPLVFAAERTGLAVVPRAEERGAAFFALGHARARGTPTAVCTTSGTALANCLPALAEAAAVGAPLIVVGADRPAHLHGSGAPQTMVQHGIFADFVAAACDCGDPAPARAEAMLGELAAALSAVDRGPVQVEVPLDDPLPPVPDPDWRPPPLTTVPPPEAHTTLDDTWHERGEEACAAIGAAERPLVVVGPDAPVPGGELVALAKRWRAPVILDATSNARGLPIPGAITTADALLAGAMADQRPDLLLRIGPAPVARAAWEYCVAQTCPVVRIDRGPPARDFCHREFVGLPPPDPAGWRRLIDACATADPNWLEVWSGAERTAVASAEDWLADAPWCEAAAAARACRLDGERLAWFANSLPVRHAGLHFRPGDAVPAYAHRGVCGIDGTIGAFLGAVRAHGGPARLVCGDLAFLHDLPSLAGGDGAAVTIVVIDNRGGGIFDLLPVAGLDGYERLVRMPQEVEPVACAHAFGWDHVRCEDAASLDAALAAGTREPRIVHVPVPVETTASSWRELLAAMNGRG